MMAQARNMFEPSGEVQKLAAELARTERRQRRERFKAEQREVDLEFEVATLRSVIEKLIAVAPALKPFTEAALSTVGLLSDVAESCSTMLSPAGELSDKQPQWFATFQEKPRGVAARSENLAAALQETTAERDALAGELARAERERRRLVLIADEAAAELVRLQAGGMSSAGCSRMCCDASTQTIELAAQPLSRLTAALSPLCNDVAVNRDERHFRLRAQLQQCTQEDDADMKAAHRSYEAECAQLRAVCHEEAQAAGHYRDLLEQAGVSKAAMSSAGLEGLGGVGTGHFRARSNGSPEDAERRAAAMLDRARASVFHEELGRLVAQLQSSIKPHGEMPNAVASSYGEPLLALPQAERRPMRRQGSSMSAPAAALPSLRGGMPASECPPSPETQLEENRPEEDTWVGEPIVRRACVRQSTVALPENVAEQCRSNASEGAQRTDVEALMPNPAKDVAYENKDDLKRKTTTPMRAVETDAATEASSVTTAMCATDGAQEPVSSVHEAASEIASPEGVASIAASSEPDAQSLRLQITAARLALWEEKKKWEEQKAGSTMGMATQPRLDSELRTGEAATLHEAPVTARLVVHQPPSLDVSKASAWSGIGSPDVARRSRTPRGVSPPRSPSWPPKSVYTLNETLTQSQQQDLTPAHAQDKIGNPRFGQHGDSEEEEVSLSLGLAPTRQRRRNRSRSQSIKVQTGGSARQLVTTPDGSGAVTQASVMDSARLRSRPCSNSPVRRHIDPRAAASESLAPYRGDMRRRTWNPALGLWPGEQQPPAQRSGSVTVRAIGSTPRRSLTPVHRRSLTPSSRFPQSPAGSGCASTTPRPAPGESCRSLVEGFFIIREDSEGAPVCATCWPSSLKDSDLEKTLVQEGWCPTPRLLKQHYPKGYDGEPFIFTLRSEILPEGKDKYCTLYGCVCSSDTNHVDMCMPRRAAATLPPTLSKSSSAGLIQRATSVSTFDKGPSDAGVLCILSTLPLFALLFDILDVLRGNPAQAEALLRRINWIGLNRRLVSGGIDISDMGHVRKRLWARLPEEPLEVWDWFSPLLAGEILGLEAENVLARWQAHWALQVLLSRWNELVGETLLRLLVCILLDCKVLLLADAARGCTVALVLQALMSPFRWSHLLLSAPPPLRFVIRDESESMLLGAPSPCLLVMTERPAHWSKNAGGEPVVTADLRQDWIFWPSGTLPGGLSSENMKFPGGGHTAILKKITEVKKRLTERGLEREQDAEVIREAVWSEVERLACTIRRYVSHRLRHVVTDGAKDIDNRVRMAICSLDTFVRWLEEDTAHESLDMTPFYTAFFQSQTCINMVNDEIDTQLSNAGGFYT